MSNKKVYVIEEESPRNMSTIIFSSFKKALNHYEYVLRQLTDDGAELENHKPSKTHQFAWGKDKNGIMIEVGVFDKTLF